MLGKLGRDILIMTGAGLFSLSVKGQVIKENTADTTQEVLSQVAKHIETGSEISVFEGLSEKERHKQEKEMIKNALGPIRIDQETGARFTHPVLGNREIIPEERENDGKKEIMYVISINGISHEIHTKYVDLKKFVVVYKDNFYEQSEKAQAIIKEEYNKLCHEAYNEGEVLDSCDQTMFVFDAILGEGKKDEKQEILIARMEDMVDVLHELYLNTEKINSGDPTYENEIDIYEHKVIDVGLFSIPVTIARFELIEKEKK